MEHLRKRAESRPGGAVRPSDFIMNVPLADFVVSSTTPGTITTKEPYVYRIRPAIKAFAEAMDNLSTARINIVLSAYNRREKLAGTIFVR